MEHHPDHRHAAQTERSVIRFHLKSLSLRPLTRALSAVLKIFHRQVVPE